MITDLTLGENIFNSPDLSIKMKILHAVNKSLDQITVAEICRNAGISRQTFYRHFESKYDIPWWYSIFCRQFYLNEIGDRPHHRLENGLLPPSAAHRPGARFLP